MIIFNNYSIRWSCETAPRTMNDDGVPGPPKFNLKPNWYNQTSRNWLWMDSQFPTQSIYPCPIGRWPVLASAFEPTEKTVQKRMMVVRCTLNHHHCSVEYGGLRDVVNEGRVKTLNVLKLYDWPAIFSYSTQKSLRRHTRVRLLFNGLV